MDTDGDLPTDTADHPVVIRARVYAADDVNPSAGGLDTVSPRKDVAGSQVVLEVGVDDGLGGDGGCCLGLEGVGDGCGSCLDEGALDDVSCQYYAFIVTWVGAGRVTNSYLWNHGRGGGLVEGHGGSCRKVAAACAADSGRGVRTLREDGGGRVDSRDGQGRLDDGDALQEEGF